MITKFKLFENNYNYARRELIEQFDDDYIEDYYMNNYNIDIIDIIELNIKYVYDYIDDDKFVEDWIENDINSSSFEDYNESEYKNFIEDNIDDDMEKEIIKIYKETNNIKDTDDIISDIDGKVNILTKNNNSIISIVNDNGKVKKYKVSENCSIVVNDGDIIEKNTILAVYDSIEYDYSMLDDLNEEQLRSVIEKCDKEDDFVKETVNNRWDGYDTKEIIEEIYGRDVSASVLYNLIQWYIDDEDKIIEDFKKETDSEWKEDYVLDCLISNYDIYDYLIDKDEENILRIVNYLLSQNATPIYSNDYEFQDKYIEVLVKSHFKDSKYNENEENEIIANALVLLNDNFELNDRIKDEYSDYMWKITSSKYNL